MSEIRIEASAFSEIMEDYMRSCILLGIEHREQLAMAEEESARFLTKAQELEERLIELESNTDQPDLKVEELKNILVTKDQQIEALAKIKDMAVAKVEKLKEELKEFGERNYHQEITDRDARIRELEDGARIDKQTMEKQVEVIHAKKERIQDMENKLMKPAFYEIATCPGESSYHSHCVWQNDRIQELEVVLKELLKKRDEHTTELE